MRETRAGASRKITRSSKPSTSSETENPSSLFSDAPPPKKFSAQPQVDIDGEDITLTPIELRSKRVAVSKPAITTTQKNRQSREVVVSRNTRSSHSRHSASDTDTGDGPELTSSTLADNLTSRYGEENVPTTSSSSLRRSAREPRPKRALSPTPTSPKRRPRVKKPSLTLMQDEDHGVAVYGPIDPVEVSEGCSDEQVVADDDMENDLVDIQPFETNEAVNEVFMTANFSKREAAQHVNVSVLTLPQLSENIEHSTEDPLQLRGTDSSVPFLENEIIVRSSGFEVDQEGTESGSRERQLGVQGESKPNVAHDDEVLEVFSAGRSQPYVAVGDRDDDEEDAGSQMEPPVLDGPIIDPSTFEPKPSVDAPPKLMADGVLSKENPKPMHYVVGEIYRVHTPNGTEQEVQLAVMDDGSEALVNANGEVVDLAPEDSYATVDICDIDFNFLDDKNIVCGLCGEVVLYATLFTTHLARVHPEMLDPELLVGQLPYVEFLKRKLDSERKSIQNGFKYSKQTILRRTPRRVSQIRINPSEMTLPQLEIALRKKLLEKMGRRVKVSLVDKEHVKCGICSSVISINKKFEIVHVVRHFNAWHPTNHQCAGQWQKRTQRPEAGKPLSKQDFAVIDLSHTQPDNLQCIWCGMFIDATTIAVHFTDCHPGEVEVPKCLLCIQELVINARVIEKFGSDFDIVLPDEFHIKVEKLNKLFTSESQMDSAIEKYLDTLNGKRKRAPLTVERRVFEGDSVVVHTTAIPGDDDPEDGADEEVLSRPQKPITTNSRQVFGRHNKPKRSMVQPIYRQAPPTNSDYVKVISNSHWKCKICDADLYGAVISACAIRHFKLKHPQESDSLQFEVVRARLDRISDGCMEFVHPQMLECLICHLTYQLHKPYNVCRGIRHLRSRHPEIMPEFNGEPLRRYRKTGTALRLDDDPNIPRRRKEAQLSVRESADILARMKAQYPGSFDKVRTVYGSSGEPMFVLMNGDGEQDELVKDGLKLLSESVSSESHNKGVEQNENCDGEISTGDLKSGKEVVFELSYDYNNLDADGKPQKHLVRVTPSNERLAGSKLQPNVPNVDKGSGYVVEGEVEGEASIDQAETSEVYFDNADRANIDSADESGVILGDVLFIDPDGNEIIQRNTALPDGSIETQYLGQAEDGSLFVLNDIVSAGLHPSGENVDEVYDDDEMMGVAATQELILQEQYGNQGNVPGHRYRRVAHNAYSRDHGELVEVAEFNEENAAMVQSPYDEEVVAMHENYAEGMEGEEGLVQYSGEVVVGEEEQFVQEGIVLNEEEFRENLVTKPIDTAAASRGFDRDTSEIEHSLVAESQKQPIGQNVQEE
uniref:C2H2-type domain-containing protein n=1 Tax=Haemonchus contortus TaxID=6289 RepID=A0A7I4YEA3_HAECO